MTLPRRTALAAVLAGAGALATGCTARPGSSEGVGGTGAVAEVGSLVGTATAGSAADDVSGPFSWRRAEGASLHVFLGHPGYLAVLRERGGAFTALTGIELRFTLLPEREYVERMTTELVAGADDVDVFMTGAHMVWQYGPPGWMEDLDPWLANSSATSAEYDPDDVLPHLQNAMRWNFVLGDPVGTGGRYGLPWGWESNVLAYRADVFAQLGLRPPGTLDEMDEVARAAHAHMAATADGGYGLGVRGVTEWDTVLGGFMTQYARQGGQDFQLDAGHLAPAVDSPASVDFHRRWTSLVRDAGPPQYADQTWRGCASNLGNGRSAMVLDSSVSTLDLDPPGRSAVSGRLAWSPGPAGPGGDLTSSLWVWSLAMASRSRQKEAAWLFLQWATSAECVRWAAMRRIADPVRTSVMADPGYRDALGLRSGYLDSLEALQASTRVVSTPQQYFFGAATAWASSLRRMHEGADVGPTLALLADRMRRRA